MIFSDCNSPTPPSTINIKTHQVEIFPALKMIQTVKLIQISEVPISVQVASLAAVQQSLLLVHRAFTPIRVVHQVKTIKIKLSQIPHNTGLNLEISKMIKIPNLTRSLLRKLFILELMSKTILSLSMMIITTVVKVLPIKTVCLVVLKTSSLVNHHASK